MNKTCVICEDEGRYKCPTCLVFYCSVTCCKKHRAGKCDVVKKEETSVKGEKQEGDENDEALIVKRRKIETNESEVVVPTEKLDLLRSNEEVSKLLMNGHLRNLLKVIDKADKAEDSDDIMDKVMHEPIFVEFADACLKVVDPPSDGET